MADDQIIRQILELARWAPSGDNTQPWRFEIIDNLHAVIHGHDTRQWCVYDLQGHASQLALGGLLETIAIAASTHGLTATSQRRTASLEENPIFDVYFAPSTSNADPLATYITTRSVQRRPMRTRALDAEEKAALEASVGKDYRIVWLEGWQNKWRTAKLLFANAHLRLTLPEAYAVHKSVIDWAAKFSEDRLPGHSVGLDPVTLKFSKWVMQNWRRVDFFNTYLAGTWAPRIQLDLIPALACAAHFLITASKEAHTIDDYLAAGRAMQRFWLTAEKLGLRLQPEMTPLIFSGYARHQITFSTTMGAMQRADQLAHQLTCLAGAEVSAQAVFMGRIGHANRPKYRSLRLPMGKLLLP